MPTLRSINITHIDLVAIGSSFGVRSVYSAQSGVVVFNMIISIDYISEQNPLEFKLTTLDAL